MTVIATEMTSPSAHSIHPHTASSEVPIKYHSLQIWYGRDSRARNRMQIPARAIVFSLTTSSFEGPQVRLVLNGATFPLSICEQSEEDREYGTCSLVEFVRANEYNLNVEYNSEMWNATCGVLR